MAESEKISRTPKDRGWNRLPALFALNGRGCGFSSRGGVVPGTRSTRGRDPTLWATLSPLGGKATTTGSTLNEPHMFPAMEFCIENGNDMQQNIPPLEN